MKNQQEILKINNEIIEKFNLSQKCEDAKVSDINEILDILSSDFIKNYESVNDYQEAFNLTMDEYKEFANEYAFVYSLKGGAPFKVIAGDNYIEENLNKYIEIAQDAYTNRKIETLEDILHCINIDIEKTKCNVGCDVFTAYNLIMDEHFYDIDGDDIFVIDNSEQCEPKIEILY